MSQYTDKINAIAEDFKYIEEAESVSAIQGCNGTLSIMYKHGGERIEITRDGVEVDGKLYNKGDVIITKPYDQYYIMLQEKYNKTGPTLNEKVTNWFANIRKRFIKNDSNRSFWKS